MRPGDHRGCRQHPGAPIGTFAEVNRYHGPETRDLDGGVFRLDREPQQAHSAYIGSPASAGAPTHRNPEPHAKRQSQSIDHAVAGPRRRLIA